MRVSVQTLICAGFSILMFIGCLNDDKQYFKIERGHAKITLMAFAQQANIDLVFDDKQLADIQTNSVNGFLNVETALSEILKDTGLLFEYDEYSKTFTISRNKTKEM